MNKKEYLHLLNSNNILQIIYNRYLELNKTNKILPIEELNFFLAATNSSFLINDIVHYYNIKFNIICIQEENNKEIKIITHV